MNSYKERPISLSQPDSKSDYWGEVWVMGWVGVVKSSISIMLQKELPLFCPVLSCLGLSSSLILDNPGDGWPRCYAQPWTHLFFKFISTFWVQMKDTLFQRTSDTNLSHSRDYQEQTSTIFLSQDRDQSLKQNTCKCWINFGGFCPYSPVQDGRRPAFKWQKWETGLIVSDVTSRKSRLGENNQCLYEMVSLKRVFSHTLTH